MDVVLPVVLWCSGLVVALTVMAIAVASSDLKAKDRHHPSVKPVPWAVAYAHLASLLLFGAGYMVLILGIDGYHGAWKAFYEAALWPSIVATFVLVLAQVALLYLQSRRAMLSQMDEILKAAGSRR